MVSPMIPRIFRQLFKKPSTNLFPVKYAPKNMHSVVRGVERGEAKLNPPVAAPSDLRGKVAYDRESCIGCRMCLKVCPANAIEFISGPGGKHRGGKVKFFMSRCTFCEMCVEICPKDCIRMTTDFLLADTDKESNNLVVIDSGSFEDQK